MTWEETVEETRAKLWDAIPEKWQDKGLKEDMIAKGFKDTGKYLDTILPKEEIAITSLTVLELKDKLQSRKLTAVAVAEAFCHRAALVQQILNVCTNIFFDKALERAKELDDYFEKNGKPVGELHGIPISLKDQVDLPGMASSIAYVSRLTQPMTEMSLLAEFLQKNGAIFYVKTTTPMSLLTPECISNAFGYTSNARNIKMSSGGSSGGEGALIGAGGSPLGFGTDTGGSIRIPSAFNGLYGFKPATGRISYLRVSNTFAGQETLSSVIGPMGKSLEDIQFITKFIINGGLWKEDPRILPIPYREQEKVDKYTFGIWKYDKNLMPNPPILRAIEETAEKLKKKGHEVIEIELPHQDEMMASMGEIFSADQGFEVRERCKASGEPVVPAVGNLIPRDDSNPPITVNPWWDICERHYEMNQKFLKFWNSTAEKTESGKPIDAIVAPIWPSAACYPDFPNALNYTFPCNLYNLASAIIPVTTVDQEKDLPVEYTPVNEIDKSVYESYEPSKFKDMPVCLQVMGRHLEDEKILAIASVVDSK